MKNKSKVNILLDKTKQVLSDNNSKMSPSNDFMELVHELQTYQIELEMQNLELRKKSEELEKSRLKYYNLYEFAPVGYFSLDSNEIIKDVNLAGTVLLDFEKPDLINNAFIRYMNPESRIAFYKHLKKVKTTGTRQTSELTLQKKDGTQVYVQLKTLPIRNNEEEEFRITANDITKRKQVENKLNEYKNTLEEKVEKRTAELAKSNAELEQFTYVSSHDLQEPLRIVGSFSQLLEQRYKGQLDDDADEYIEFIVEGAHRIKYLIDDLLAFSQVSSQDAEFENVNLENIFNKVISNLFLSIKENKVTITHDPLPTVWADKYQMIQVFQYLIGNAIKFHGPNPPEIHITAYKHGKEWKFEMTDNGIGISLEYQKQIFEVFKRLHTREQYPGSGIGLSVSQKIIRRHGGNIWVKSELGKGSTFYFTLPIKTIKL